MMKPVVTVQQLSDEDNDSDLDIKEEMLSEEESYDEDSQEEELSSLDGDVKDEVGEASDDGNVGMAAVMAKILKKSVPSDGPAIMSKSVSEKQLAARKRRHLDNAEPGGEIEVVKTEVSIKTEPVDSKERKLKKRRLVQNTASLKLKQEKEELCHTIPDTLDRTRELSLIKIATRGVVQLFNAVKQQQGKIKEKVKEVKKSVRKTDKAISEFTSGDFLDRLKSQKVRTVNNSSSNPDEEVKPEVKEEPSWSALRDDFMMGSQSMKDWDKEEDEDATEGLGDCEQGADTGTDSEGD